MEPLTYVLKKLNQLQYIHELLLYLHLAILKTNSINENMNDTTFLSQFWLNQNSSFFFTSGNGTSNFYTKDLSKVSSHRVEQPKDVRMPSACTTISNAAPRTRLCFCLNFKIFFLRNM